MAISLTKGMRMRKDGPQLISQMISSQLRINCSVLMGANVATDIAQEQLSEATIGFTDIDNARLLQKVFARPYFLVTTIPDVVRRLAQTSFDKDTRAIASTHQQGRCWDDVQLQCQWCRPLRKLCLVFAQVPAADSACCNDVILLVGTGVSQWQGYSV
jgi:hypothetical protein